jgi:hypothetical protein
MRRMCAPMGQRKPFGSPDASLFTYSKSVQLVRFDSTGRRIGVRRKLQRDSVPPAATDLGSEQFRVDLVFVALQKVLEADHPAASF